MAVTTLHMFGWQKETDLKATLEQHLGEELSKTTWRYDSIDFTGPSWNVELKSRLPRDKKGNPQRPGTFETWLVPASKIDSFARSAKKGRVYYFWDFDQSLWYLDYESVDWSTVERGVPMWHLEQHYWVPRNLWRRVEC